MHLAAEHLQSLLAPRPIKFYAQTESTQDVALQWLQEGAATGSVVIADEQLSGRGRHSRVWSTPPGVALAMSIILRPAIAALPQVMMLGALTIIELLDGFGADVATIKWPNDVRLHGRKVCGVLPEAVWDGDQLRGVALGIGVNVRNDFSNTLLQETAISLETAFDQTLDRAKLIADLVPRLDYWSARLGTTVLFEAWQARLETVGQMVTVTSTAGTVSGLAESVDEHGALFVRDGDRVLHRILAGDIAP
jgi:BirA family transcriptional regulator, biotin operon repressor / biotin---[acetyl-CoA-carboxylase] ligase